MGPELLAIIAGVILLRFVAKLVLKAIIFSVLISLSMPFLLPKLDPEGEYREMAFDRMDEVSIAGFPLRTVIDMIDEHIGIRPSNGDARLVDVAVVKHTLACNKDEPLAVTILNGGDAAVARVDYFLEGRHKERSSWNVLSRNSSDYIVKPGEGKTFCAPYDETLLADGIYRARIIRVRFMRGELAP